jgi:aminoglycoside phosphotransferase (APT) family kinase protein
MALESAAGADDLAGRLAALCARHLGVRGAIESLRRLAGGASQQIWSFDFLTDSGERFEWVLRRGTSSQMSNLTAATEFALLEAARAGDVPVPLPRFPLTADDALGEGYVMERIAGETIPRKILRDDAFAAARPRMAAQAGRILAKIHALDVSTLAGIPGASADAPPATAALDQLRELGERFAEPHPVFELALRWLRSEMPEPTGRCLVHGDFRNGNLMVDRDGIRSVLDWELAHVGDPLEDLGWLCVPSWRFGVVDKPVGGFGEIEDLCAAYAEAGGVGADPAAVRYWIVLGTLRWGVICQAQAFTHRSGSNRSVELAAIGRRVCETEWDLLNLID